MFKQTQELHSDMDRQCGNVLGSTHTKHRQRGHVVGDSAHRFQRAVHPIKHDHRGGEVESFNGRGATGGAASAEAAEAAGPAGVGEKKAPVGDRRQGGAREAGDAQARAGRLSACR